MADDEPIHDDFQVTDRTPTSDVRSHGNDSGLDWKSHPMSDERRRNIVLKRSIAEEVRCRHAILFDIRSSAQPR